MMHEHGKSDGPAVPSKPSNKADADRLDRVHPNRAAAERGEARGPAKENPHEGDTLRTQGRNGVQQVLARV
jgi:hypothetical protein